MRTGFSRLSSARARTNVILAGKRRVLARISENVAAKTTYVSYQMLEMLSFSDRERA